MTEFAHLMLQRVDKINSPIELSDLQAFEIEHSLQLPVEYRDFLIRFNGGKLTPSGFPIHGHPIDPFGRIQVMFGLNSSDAIYDIRAHAVDLEDHIPHGVLPIGCTEGVPFICLDLRNGKTGVLYWDNHHFWGTGEWRESDLYHIADSFAFFLDGLHELKL